MGLTLEKSFDYFLKEDFNGYKEGEWVAIHENKIIAHGFELKKVIELAKEKAPIAKVLFSKVKKTASFL